MLKIPINDFTPGFPGDLHISVSFNGEKGSAQANHVEEYISLSAVPVLEGDELAAKIDSLWDDSKSELDVQEFEVDGGFFGDSFVMELQSYGCSYASGDFGNSESEMLRIDYDVLATGEGISEIYVPASFLDIEANALIAQDAYYGDTQMSVRGGAAATGSLLFDVGDCGVLDSAVFLAQDDEGHVLIELDLFDPTDKVVSNVESQVTPSAGSLKPTSTPTIDPTASPIPISSPTTTPAPTSLPESIGNTLSRITISPLGEFIEAGFESVFLMMYDGDDKPTFVNANVTIAYTDLLGKVMYASDLVNLTDDSRWGPTLDGSDGAMLKIPLADFSAGFPGPITIVVTAETDDGVVVQSEYSSEGGELFSFTSVPTYEGQELSQVIEEQWVVDRTPIEDVTTGEFTSIEGLFSSDVYEISPVWTGCAWAESIFGGVLIRITRVDLQVRTTIEGVHEIYLPNAYIDDGGGQLLEPNLLISTTNIAIRKGDVATATYYFGSDGCLSGDLTFIQENHSGEIVIEAQLVGG